MEKEYTVNIKREELDRLEKYIRTQVFEAIGSYVFFVLMMLLFSEIVEGVCNSLEIDTLWKWIAVIPMSCFLYAFMRGR